MQFIKCCEEQRTFRPAYLYDVNAPYLYLINAVQVYLLQKLLCLRTYHYIPFFMHRDI